MDLAWVYELRDTGKYGFLLPPNQIIPTSEEVISSYVAMAAELRKNTIWCRSTDISNKFDRIVYEVKAYKKLVLGNLTPKIIDENYL